MLNPWLQICTCFESAKVIPLLKHQLISNILTVLHIDSFHFWHLCMYSYIYNRRSRSLLGCRPCYCIHKQQLKGKCNRIEELLTFIEFEINVGINLMKYKSRETKYGHAYCLWLGKWVSQWRCLKYEEEKRIIFLA